MANSSVCPNVTFTGQTSCKGHHPPPAPAVKACINTAHKGGFIPWVGVQHKSNVYGQIKRPFNSSSAGLPFLGLFSTADGCQAACEKRSNCTQYSWTLNVPEFERHCFGRCDDIWDLHAVPEQYEVVAARRVAAGSSSSSGERSSAAPEQQQPQLAMHYGCKTNATDQWGTVLQLPWPVCIPLDAPVNVNSSWPNWGAVSGNFASLEACKRSGCKTDDDELSPACQTRMDEYCSTRAASDTGETCKAALSHVGCNTTFLVARRDLLGADQWRCFSPSALDSSLSRYAPNATGSHCYCTRDKQLSSLCSGPPPPPGPPTPSGPPSGSVPAFTSGHDGYHTYRIPSLVKLTNGDILLFAEARKLSGSDHGWNDIVMKRSVDNGQHWSEQVKVYGESTATKSVCIGNPAPIGRRDGTVVLVACRDNSEVLVLRSNVLATSWSNATYVTEMVKAPAWTWIATGPPQGVELPSGRLLVAADHIGKGGGWGSHAMFRCVVLRYRSG